MKKIFAILMTIVMIVTLMSACNNEESQNNTDPVVVTGDVTPAEFNASTYLMDNWREEAEDGTKIYYITLLMYSEDYYARPTADDIKYKTDSDYVPFTEAVEGSTITVYPVNTEYKSGICTYVKIRTTTLIDTKKIYVRLAGPAKYDENTLTEDSYREAHGSLDGWRTLLTNVSTRPLPNDAAAEMQISINYGVLRLYDNYRSQYYYASVNPTPVIDGCRMITKVEIDPLTENASMETLIEHMTQYSEFAVIENGAATSVKLDNRLKVVCEVVDGEFWVGFETVDGSDISAFDGEIPDAIAYPYSTVYYLVVK